MFAKLSLAQLHEVLDLFVPSDVDGVSLTKSWTMEQEFALKQHIEAVQLKAIEIFPYPCIRMFAFVTPRMSKHFEYEAVVADIANNKRSFLDIGCCFGTDLRKLIVNVVSVGGVAASNASQFFGLELRREFVDLGYELFKDKSTCKIHFVQGNILLPNSNDELPVGFPLKKGSFDYVFAGSVIHLFSKENIVLFVKRAFALLGRGGVFFGRHIGLKVPGLAPENVYGFREHADTYLHSAQSFGELLEFCGFDDISVRETEQERPVTDPLTSTRQKVYWIEFFAKIGN